MSILKSLREMQAELKAPKGQYNSFGKYKYRSAEDILEAVKPLAVKHKLTFHIDDTIVMVGDRIYIKSTVVVQNDAGEEVTSSSYAREEETKKGMDGSQVTGAASSYARKYALNAMLLIDDTKDSDATNSHGQDNAPEPKKNVSQKSDDKDLMTKSIEHIKGSANKQQAYDTIMKHYADKFTEKQIEAIKKFVR